MPSRKQRRRRAKERRHEYEYVYVDEEGREVEVEPEEIAEEKRDSRAARTTGRSGRTVEPPSLRRVVKRALLFAPLMFLTITLIDRDLSISVRLTQTIMLLAFFLPFSYLMDRMLYRSFARRTSAPRDAGRRR
jgi:hypothetical protein